MEAEVRTDQDYLSSAARGDQRAYAALFERHSDFVYNVAFRRTASWSAAEDITEIVFVELWRQRQRITTVGGSIRPWLAGVTSNQSKRWWRDNARKARAVERLGVRSAPETTDGDPAELVAGRVDDQRQMRALLAAVEELPADQREVLTLWAWEQLSYDEIAVALGIPVGTVRSRLSRARSRLRDAGDRGDGGTRGTQGAFIPKPPNGAAEAMRPGDEPGGNR